MNKKLLKIVFTVYALMILGFAGFARAESRIASYTNHETKRALTIEAVNLDDKTYDLEIVGYAPNSCYGAPQARLVPEGPNSNVLFLELVASPSTGICNSQIAPFVQIVNLPELAMSSSLDLIPGSTYLIKAHSVELTMEIPLAQTL